MHRGEEEEEEPGPEAGEANARPADITAEGDHRRASLHRQLCDALE